MSLTSGEVMDEAALLLNDAAKITFTYAVQAPWLRRAVNEYSDELAVNSIPLLRKISTTAPLLSGNASVPLPSDALLPIMLEERAYGSSEAFSGMTQLDTIPVNQTAGNSLDFWAFEGTLLNSVPVINTPGATNSREVRITYQKFLPYSGIVDGTTDFSTSIAANSKRFLASKVAELISRFVLQNVARGNELKSESGQSLYRIIQIWTKFRQRTPIRKGRYNNPTPFDTPFNYPQISSGGGSGPIATTCPGPYINVTCFGVVGDGITDDTTAINAVIVANPGKVLYFPAKTYLITNTININTDRTHIRGDGQQSTIFKFLPITIIPAFHFKAPTAITLVQNSIRGISIISTGNIIEKQGIRFTDCEEMIVDDISMIALSSTAKTCIGLQFRGRQTHSVSNILISADIPISIEPNPNSVLSLDHFHFWNCQLGTANGGDNTTPIVQILPGCQIQNLIMDGYQSWGRGKYGFYWNDVTVPGQSICIHLENIRWEQDTDVTGYFIYINIASNIQNFAIKNCYGGNTSGGLLLRNIVHATILNYYRGGATTEALNINATCTSFMFISCFFAPGSIFSLGGFADWMQLMCVGIPLTAGGSVGFYGVAGIQRQLFATGTGKTVDQLIGALQVLGLLRQV